MVTALSPHPHVTGGARELCGVSCKGTEVTQEASVSCPNRLPKAPPPFGDGPRGGLRKAGCVSPSPLSFRPLLCPVVQANLNVMLRSAPPDAGFEHSEDLSLRRCWATPRRLAIGLLGRGAGKSAVWRAGWGSANSGETTLRSRVLIRGAAGGAPPSFSRFTAFFSGAQTAQGLDGCAPHKVVPLELHRPLAPPAVSTVSLTASPALHFAPWDSSAAPDVHLGSPAPLSPSPPGLEVGVRRLYVHGALRGTGRPPVDGGDRLPFRKGQGT